MARPNDYKGKPAPKPIPQRTAGKPVSTPPYGGRTSRVDADIRPPKGGRGPSKNVYPVKTGKPTIHTVKFKPSVKLDASQMRDRRGLEPPSPFARSLIDIATSTIVLPDIWGQQKPGPPSLKPKKPQPGPAPKSGRSRGGSY